MSVSSSGKRRCTDRGIPSRILAISPAIRDSTKVQNAVSPPASVSGILQFLCVGLRMRKSIAFALNSPWLEICLAGPAQFFNLPAQLFVLNFSIPFGIPFYNGGRVIKHLITLCHRLAERAFPVPASSEWYGYSHRKCQPAAFC